MDVKVSIIRNLFWRVPSGGLKVNWGTPRGKLSQFFPLCCDQFLSFLRDSPGHNAWRVAILCCFRGLLMKSQVTESDASLLWEDFHFYSWGLLIKVRKCKTIQFQERSLMIPITRCRDRSLCAVYWCEQHFKELPADGDKIAFMIPAERGSAPLTYYLYQKMFKLFGERAGYDPALLSSHSLRRGGCTFLSTYGASLEEIKARIPIYKVPLTNQDSKWHRSYLK